MKDRPILFSAPMVRAILDGSKTQTRRIVKPQPTYNRHGLVLWWKDKRNGIQSREERFNELAPRLCPYGKPGDRLWVRETHILSPAHFADRDLDLYNVTDSDGNGRICQYLATNPDTDTPVMDYGLRVRPSIHMPRWASRITLEVTDVRVERLQDISGRDAEAEGVERCDNPDHGFINAVGGEIGRLGCPGCGGDPDGEAVKAFHDLWESINGPGSWDKNPWVWVVEFRKLPTNTEDNG